ncbi:MAG: hypothetical protein ACI9K3_001542, partial [Halovenus sp.]
MEGHVPGVGVEYDSTGWFVVTGARGDTAGVDTDRAPLGPVNTLVGVTVQDVVVVATPDERTDDRLAGAVVNRLGVTWFETRSVSSSRKTSSSVRPRGFPWIS